MKDTFKLSRFIKKRKQWRYTITLNFWNLSFILALIVAYFIFSVIFHKCLRQISWSALLKRKRYDKTHVDCTVNSSWSSDRTFCCSASFSSLSLSDCRCCRRSLSSCRISHCSRCDRWCSCNTFSCNSIFPFSELFYL